MVLKMVKFMRSGVKMRSFATSYLKVSSLLRLDLRLIVRGINFGNTPTVPKSPCERSCVIEPTSSVGAAILKELFKLGSNDRTVALEKGNCTGPTESHGCPKA